MIAFGGSYGGMLTAWARLKYPTVFDGAISGSAPILAFTGDERENARVPGNKSYWSVVTADASEEYGSVSDCQQNVRAAYKALWDFGQTMSGRKALQAGFQMCSPLYT